MEAEALVLPDLAAVTQGGVKHATTSVSPDPGDRVVLVGPLSLADVDRAGIELQQHVDLVPRPVSELVDLVGDLEAGSEVLRRGMGGILDHEPHALGPRVAVEVGADELAVLGHLVPGVGGAVDADEAAAPLDEAEQGLPSLWPERKTPGRVEEDGANLGEGVGGETLEILVRVEPATDERVLWGRALLDGTHGGDKVDW